MTEYDYFLLGNAAVGYYNFNSGNRYYHNIHHALRVSSLVSWHDSTALKIAALWHDAIYIPGSSVNEIASADALRYEWKKLAIENDTEILNTACFLITETTVNNHLRSSRIEGSYERQELTAILLDADLRSLADPYIDFRTNQDNIIRENGGNPFVREDNRKCAEFLSKFLTCREYIYHTDIDRELHETNARQNITRYMQETKA